MDYKIQRITNGFLLWLQGSVVPMFCEKIEEVLKRIQENETVIEQQRNMF